MRIFPRTIGRAVAGCAALLISAAATVPVDPGAAAQPRLAPGDVEPQCGSTSSGKAGTWTRRPVPAFPVGPAALVGHAVDAQAPLRQLVTNGHSVLVTADGCSWEEAWRLPSAPTTRLPVSAATDRVVEVVVHPRVPRLAWAVVAVGQDVAERLPLGLPFSPGGAEARDPTSAVVLRSNDAGRTWHPMRTPPLAGTPGRLALSASRPGRLFLPTSTGLHASVDGGRSWEPLPPALTGPVEGRRPLDSPASPVLVSVVVDPEDPHRLWGRTSTPVHSRDGGLTWEAYATPAGFWSGPFPGTEGVWYARQEFSTSEVRELWYGADDLTARRATVVGSPFRAARGSRSEGVLLSTWDRGNGAAFPEVSLYRIADDGAVDDVNDLDLPWVRGLVADAHGGYHLHTSTELVSLTSGARAQQQPARQVDLRPFGGTEPRAPQPAALDAPEPLQLEPGVAERLDLALALPRRPTPVDTFFLIDTSNSFEPDIQAVAEAMGEVVRSVRGAGIDAWFGVGELGTRDARRYRRFADLETPGTELQRGFERLRTGGSRESHLIALHQAATGAGLAGTTGPSVAPGQDPTWRLGTLRTLVVVTDVQYSDENDPQAPSRRQVYDALAARGIRVIGLEVVREGGDDGVPGGYAAVEAADAASTTAPTPARADLEELARATGSFAPPGGVDCRDNGTVEIRAGDPLVCTTTALHVGKLHTIGGVLRRVLLAQVDRRDVRVTVSGAAAVTPASGWRASVDVRRDRRLPFVGAVSCTADQSGQVLPLRVTAFLDRTRLAHRVVQVTCGTATSRSADPAGGPRQTSLPVSQPPTGPAAAPAAPPPPAPPAPVGGVAPGTSAAGSGAGAPATAPGTNAGAVGGTAAGAAPGTVPGSAALTAPARQEEADLSTVRVLCAGLLTSGAALALARRRSHQPRPKRTYP